MSISGIGNNSYQNTVYNNSNNNNNNTSKAGNKKPMTLTAVDGRTTMLCSDALYSMGSAITGESVNVYKSDDYSEDHPLYLLKGIDADGKEYEQTVDVSQVNPGNCSFAELLALNAHAGNRAGSNLLEMSVIRDKAGCSSYFDKADYMSSAYEVLEDQKSLGNWEGYLRYSKWIQGILKFTDGTGR